MAYKFSRGIYRHSGSLVSEEAATVESGGLTVTAGASTVQALTAASLSVDSVILDGNILQGLTALTSSQISASSTIKAGGDITAPAFHGAVDASAVRTHLSIGTPLGYDQSGSLAYDAASGEIKFAPVNPSWVKGHFSAANTTEIDMFYSASSGQFSASLRPNSINNSKLVNKTVDVVAGLGLKDGGSVALGSSVTLNVSSSNAGIAVNADDIALTLESNNALVIGPTGLDLKSTINGARIFTNDVRIEGNLTVTGSLTYLDTTNLQVKDERILMASGTTGWGVDRGFDFGSYVNAPTLLTAEATVNGVPNTAVLSSSLPLKAPSFTGTIYGSVATPVKLVADGGALSTGVNYFVDIAANAVVYLPVSPSVGDTVQVKAKGISLGNAIEVKREPSTSHLIDGVSSIFLESEFAAVTLIFVGSNDWRVF